jgi:hypothetical protein
MPKIVISYRRSDTAAMAGRIFDQLTMHYGDDAVFMDIANIPFGIDYRSHFRQTLDRADVLIALIAANWLGRNEANEVRMQEDTDPVRVEVETALKRQIPIIPVLIDGAKMPDRADLPASFANFVYLNAAEVSSGRDFSTHINRLIAAIDHIVMPTRSTESSVATPVRTRLAGLRSTDPADKSFASISRVEVIQYFLVPLLVLLVAHYLFINSFNLNVNYLRLACVLVPLIAGFALFWNVGRDAGTAVVFALVLGIIGDGAMTISESLYSGDSMLPQTRFEWLDNLQFAGTIALSFIAGHLLAHPLRTMWRAKPAKR